MRWRDAADWFVIILIGIAAFHILVGCASHRQPEYGSSIYYVPSLNSSTWHVQKVWRF